MSDSCDTMDIACQNSLFMGFSRQDYWSGLPFPSAGDLPNPGIKPGSPALQAGSFPTELSAKPVYTKNGILFSFKKKTNEEENHANCDSMEESEGRYAK